MYKIMAILDDKDKWNKMLGKYLQRTNKWLTRAMIAEVRSSNVHYVQPGIQGNLANSSKRNKRRTIAVTDHLKVYSGVHELSQ